MNDTRTSTPSIIHQSFTKKAPIRKILMGGLLLTTIMPSLAANLSTGVYSGKFGDSRATIFIDSVANGQVKGRSLYLQNYRTLTGTIKAEGSYWRVLLNEPGDRTGDGQFNLLVKQNEPTQLSGSWKVFAKNDNKSAIVPKNFTFNKTACTYQKNVGDYPEASTQLLDDDMLLQASDELDYMRNEIYARHGYSFKNPTIAGMFASQSWYVPCYTDVSKALTVTEQENLRRIKQMEDYMAKNPRKFSR